MSAKLELVPLELHEANALVARWHRHSKPVVGHKFSLGVALGEVVVGAAIVGRPVSRMLQRDPFTIEVLRCVTDGTPNACSRLYGAACRAAFAIGYRRVVTYTLKTEGGASLRASGFRVIGQVPAASWHREGRPRVGKHELQERFRWETTA
jgi:hypothetical protein